ncbi:hypothetical protein BDV28DRAFT_147020 [Aspergillus coremiiformis]|uniref:Glucose-methanol-choline oxidoreductase N-terminal domain-containing protein n=1 Tax=Aspergillus coremiiformis TaxID=138285 RepID=A0A5N6ZBL5_9EURO|nr:hypothetical protein BDV28DRAFT_147020 [Aspergillus coremiiformis]
MVRKMRGAALVSFALQSLALSSGAAAREPDSCVFRDVPTMEDASFDYIVVGGGTAGNVIATRLAQKSLKVALVEAGGQYESESIAAVPAADVIPVGSDPSTKAPHDWGFVAQNVPGANGRSIHYARGKCLGGSSAMNFMIYQRPTRESMDKWATAVNDSSYTFDQMLPYFKKSVHFTPPNTELRPPNATAGFDATAYDSQGGPLEVSYSNYALPFSSWVKRGMGAIGIHEIQDFNLGSLMGAQYCASTISPKDELRSSSESSFLASIPAPSLTTYSRTLAKKIIFDQSNKATGVQVMGPTNDTFTLRAKKEVIISAGTFQSPQLLMVSGIGPKEVLEQHDIDVLADRPGVGQNMWDHPVFAPSYRVTVEPVTKIFTSLSTMADSLLNFAVSKTGPLTSSGADYLAWEKIPESLRSQFTPQTQKDLASFPSDWPEAEYIPGAGYVGSANLLNSQPDDGYERASILGIVITPTSRGNVTLKSADTSDLPIINPNWLDTQSDQEVAVAIFKRIRQAFQSDAMAPAVIGDEVNPGPHVQTDAQIMEYIKNSVMTLWHAVGTCKMGTSDDPMAVVDNEARVYGVEGVRVVDASAFPFLPPGHPQSTVYMLAEKISDAILDGLN